MWERVPGRLVEFPLCMLIGHFDKQGMPLVCRADVYDDEKGVRKIHAPKVLLNGDPLPAQWDHLPHYNGFIDFADMVMPSPLIGDHKSAKSRRYALTPAKLQVDVQMNCYSAGALALLPEAQSVRLRHNVFLKDPAATEPAYPVNAEVTRDEVNRHWRQVVSWSIEMAELRKFHPMGEGVERADGWHKVKGAVEDGRPDECQGYGGCPFRDVCFGRCSAQQLLTRLDAPNPTFLSKPPEVKFGIRSSPTKENAAMAFNRPAPVFAAGQDIYVLDPENAQVQYRARIDTLDMPPSAGGPATESTIVLWPNVDVEPDFNSLGINFRICVPKSFLMAIPLATAKVMGYADALRATGTTEGLEWTPAVKVATPAPAAVETAKVPEKPAPDKAFGLKPSAPTAAPVTEAKVDPTPVVGTNAVVTSINCQPVYTGAGAKVGDKLVVAPSEHKFWKPLAGKEATITEITEGDTPGSVLLCVEIEGLPYDNGILPSRFLLPPNSIQAFVSANAGKTVHLVLDGGALMVNTPIEAVYNDGLTILAGTRKVAWADIQTIELFDETKHVPIGAKAEAKAAEKEAKAQEKAAAKEAKAEAKAAAKNTPAGESMTELPPLTANQALDQAVGICEEALKAGKVTRKIIEAILPLLKQVQAGGLVTISGEGAITGSVDIRPAIAPPAGAGDPVVRGIIRVAMTHAIGVLNEALTKIEA